MMTDHVFLHHSLSADDAQRCDSEFSEKQAQRRRQKAAAAAVPDVLFSTAVEGEAMTWGEEGPSQALTHSSLWVNTHTARVPGSDRVIRG